MTFEQIVKSHRTKQLQWTKRSIKRFDKILQSSTSDIISKLREIAGTGTLEESYKTSLLNSLASTLDGLKSDYAELLKVQLLGSTQIAADREAQIAGQLFSIADLEQMTKGLYPDRTHKVTISKLGEISVRFGDVAERALQAIYSRVYNDGLTLSDRLWQLDNKIRKAIEDKVVQAIASQQSARDLAADLKQYLTKNGQGNARYNAMRLARTEINTAHREGHIQSCLDNSGKLKDYIHAIGFRLSASHPEPDICDVWASDNSADLGPGNYLPDEVPVDHPHGLCYTVTILKSEPDMQFITKEPDPDNVSDSQYLAYGKEIPNAADRKPGEFTTIREAHQWARKEYPHIDWNLAGSHVDTINPTLKEFDRLAKKHPDAAAVLRTFKTIKLPEKAYAGFGPVSSVGTTNPVMLVINKVWYNDVNKFASQLALDARASWHPAGCGGIESVICHEFGHLVDHTMQVKLGKQAIRDWKKENIVGRSLSGYAATSPEEAWAEGFLAMNHGTAAVKKLDYVQKLERFLRENG